MDDPTPVLSTVPAFYLLKKGIKYGIVHYSNEFSKALTAWHFSVLRANSPLSNY